MQMTITKRVVTVSINPAIDQTLTIPNFAAGAVNRVQCAQLDAGGKGINVASFLADFGLPVTATGFLGADNDEIFARFLACKHIEDRCIRIAGKTRIGVKIIDTAQHQTTDINFPGETPSLADIEHLFDVLQELAATHDWFVLSGSIPAGVSAGIYREMIRILAGKMIVLDTSGEGFREALVARPSLIKPNVHELQEYVGKELPTPQAVVQVARDVAARFGIASVVVSMGRAGALFIENDQALWAVPPSVEVKSTVGAGDAMVAGIVAAKAQGLALEECARLATAFSMSAITRIGSGLPSLEAVWKAAQQVTVCAPSATALLYD
jgi:1-phosphofructokinase family hexose kinase